MGASILTLPATKAKLMAMIDSGVSYGSAGKKLGLTRGAVAGIIYRIRHPDADVKRDRRKLDGARDLWSESRLTERWSDRKSAPHQNQRPKP